MFLSLQKAKNLPFSTEKPKSITQFSPPNTHFCLPVQNNHRPKDHNYRGNTEETRPRLPLA